MSSIFLIFWFFLFSFNDYPSTKDRIVWKEDSKLSWDDYDKRPGSEERIDALSVCGIYCGPELNESMELIFIVEAYFIKKSSWVSSGATEYLLRHEQLHFDIAEIFARQLRSQLSVFEFTDTGLDKELESIYNRCFEAYEKDQDLYDEETNHSLDTLSQKLWEERVAHRLDSLSDYSIPLVANYSFYE